LDCDESHAQSRSPALTTNVLASFFVTLLISRQPISRPAQEVCDFDSQVSDLAQAIEKASNESHTVVLVTDFSVRSEPDSQLSMALTQDFASALRNRARRFTVVDLSDIESAISSDQLQKGARYQPRNRCLLCTGIAGNNSRQRLDRVYAWQNRPSCECVPCPR
jgi:hypothetical protein